MKICGTIVVEFLVSNIYELVLFSVRPD